MAGRPLLAIIAGLAVVVPVETGLQAARVANLVAASPSPASLAEVQEEAREASLVVETAMVVRAENLAVETAMVVRVENLASAEDRLAATALLAPVKRRATRPSLARDHPHPCPLPGLLGRGRMRPPYAMHT